MVSGDTIFHTLIIFFLLHVIIFMIGGECMSTRIESLHTNNKEIRIYEGLLMVVGNHGAGKTAFLNAIVNKEYRIISDKKYRIVPLLLSNTFVTLTTILNEVLGSEENWATTYPAYIRRHYHEKEADNILSRIPNATDLLPNVVNDLFSLKRLIIIEMLLCINERMAIVIDEPELAGHPVIVRDICIALRQLQDKGNVVILATNSETVVSKLFEDIEQVVRMEKGKDVLQVNVKQLENDILAFFKRDIYLLRQFSNSKYLDRGLNNVLMNYTRVYLSSIFRNTLFNLMHADGVILGEGSSEDVLFDYLDLVIHPEWMRDYRIQYMGCLGKNTMPFYFLFLNHMGIKTVCLYDADKNTNPVHASYAKAFAEYEQENGNIFAKMALNPDLEHVLDIVPDFKLLSIEKPVNIYHNTFVTDAIRDKVSKLSDLIKALFDKMEKEA